MNEQQQQQARIVSTTTADGNSWRLVIDRGFCIAGIIDGPDTGAGFGCQVDAIRGELRDAINRAVVMEG